MSLKLFHIFFVTASTLLAFGFGIWELRTFAANGTLLDVILGVLSLALGVGLIVYGRYVWHKIKDL